jgi:hypothetical protein
MDCEIKQLVSKYLINYVLHFCKLDTYPIKRRLLSITGYLPNKYEILATYLVACR